MIGWMPRKLTIIPLNRPQAAAAIRGSTKAKASASAGCSTPKVDVKMSGARAPASAMTAPTERSMPWVAMTSVMPVATMAIVATWLIFTKSVCSCRKFGVTSALKISSASSATRVPFSRSFRHPETPALGNGRHLDCGWWLVLMLPPRRDGRSTSPMRLP